MKPTEIKDIMYVFPQTDEEAWIEYPKLNWVYDTSRLLDSQHIKWKPFATSKFNFLIEQFTYNKDRIQVWPILNIHDADVSTNPGFIYIVEPQGKEIKTEVIIQKGEIKWMSHYNSNFTLWPSLSGEVELRINAFAALHLPKFSGIISVTTFANEIYGIKLRPTNELISKYPPDALKQFKKIFKSIII